MADQAIKYSIEYQTKTAQAVQNINALEAAVLRLDKALVAIEPRLKALGPAMTASNRAIGTGAKRLNELTAGMKAAEAQAKATEAQLKTLGSSVPANIGKGTTAVQGFGSSLLALTAGRMVLNQVTEALDAMGEAAVKAREHQNTGAQAGLDKRGKAREYANLLGHDGPDDKVMHRAFSVAMAGGYSFDNAVKFGEQFLGSSPAGVQAGHVTPEQLARLETEGARFANRIGLDPATGGDLMGVIPQYVDMTKDASGKPLTTEQGVRKAMGQMGALQYGLNEGRGKISTLARSEIGAASAAMGAGRISDHAEMGAFVGVASTFTKTASGSGTAFKQMDQLINNTDVDDWLDENGKPKKGAPPDVKGNYLKRIGVADKKGDLEKLRALKVDIDAQRTADPNFDFVSYLTSKGFKSRQERDSTIGYVNNFDVLEKRTIEARKRAGNGQDVIDANRRYSSSLEGQNQLADATMEYGNYIQTEKHQRLSIARKAALGQLQAEGKIDTSSENFKDWALDFVSGPTRKWSGDLDSHATGIDTRVRENLIKSARDAGVDLEKKYPGIGKGYGEGVTWTLDNVMNEVGPMVEAKGGSINGRSQGNNALAEAQRTLDQAAGGAPGGGAQPVVQAVDVVGQKIDNQTAAIVNAINGRRVAPPAPAPTPAAGNGGAGVNPRRP